VQVGTGQSDAGSDPGDRHREIGEQSRRDLGPYVVRQGLHGGGLMPPGRQIADEVACPHGRGRSERVDNGARHGR
jgi:hypothetical protein